MKYRREIDGLRAFAVVPVVLFHAGVPGFQGGYVGVDAFFVISGFLITSILIVELDAKQFSLMKFYERRARRILPALFFMMAVNVPAAYFLMMPEQFVDFGQSLVSVVLFMSNFLFWIETGYFEAASEAKPLLHTWSLSVEEQYYLFFPILMLLLWRFKRSVLIGVLTVLLVVSLTYSDIASSTMPSANFYLLPSRLWELLLGAICAFYTRKAGSPTGQVHNALAWIGMLLLLFSICLMTTATPFPSFYGLVPTVGTALVLVCARADLGVGRILKHRFFVGIGLISYSVYLWHQPFLAFYRVWYGHDVSTFGLFLIASASVLPAYWSWRYVEAPFRSKSGVSQVSPKSVATFAVGGLVLFGMLGLMIHLRFFELPHALPPSIKASMTRVAVAGNCFDESNIQLNKDFMCPLGVKEREATFAMLGDSHSLSVKEALSDQSAAYNLGGRYVGLSGCPPLLGIYPFRRDQIQLDCPAMVQRAFNYVAASGIHDIVLVARWNLYLGSDDWTNPQGKDFQYIGNRPNGPRGLEVNRAVFAHALNMTVAFAEKNNIRLHVLEQVPDQPLAAESIYFRAIRQGAVSLDDMSLSRDEYVNQNAPANRVFEEAARGSNAITLYYSGAIFCELSRCPVGTADKSYYFDDDHLSLIGAQKLNPVWVEMIADFVPRDRVREHNKGD